MNKLYNPVGKAEITNAGLMVTTQSGYMFFYQKTVFCLRLNFLKIILEIRLGLS